MGGRSPPDGDLFFPVPPDTDVGANYGAAGGLVAAGGNSGCPRVARCAAPRNKAKIRKVSVMYSSYRYRDARYFRKRSARDGGAHAEPACESNIE